MKKTFFAFIVLSYAIVSCSFAANPEKNGSTLEYLQRETYNEECKKINPFRNTKQASYRSLYIGDKKNEVEKTMGLPVKIIISTEEEIWMYSNANFLFASNELTRLTVYEADETFISLKSIVNQYGCPAINYVLDQDEEPDGDYDLIVFSYPENGIEFRYLFFDGHVGLREAPFEVRYFTPISISDFILMNPLLQIESNSSSKLVDWGDIVE